MRIPKNFQSQIPATSLWIAIGVWEGKIYFANNGSIDELDHIILKKEDYSDDEGFFQRSGGGQVMSSGSVKEDNNESQRREFVKVITESIKKYLQQKNPDSVYFFAPQHIAPLIKKDLDAEIIDNIKYTKLGNYVSDSPLELLKKYCQEQEKNQQTNKIKKASREARYLLEKTKKMISSKFKK